MLPFHLIAGFCLLSLCACSQDPVDGRLDPRPKGLTGDESQAENIGRAFWHFEAEKFDPDGPFEIQLALLCRYRLTPEYFGKSPPNTGLMMVISALDATSPISAGTYQLSRDVVPIALPNDGYEIQTVVDLDPNVTGKFLLRFNERPDVTYEYDLDAPGPAWVKDTCLPPDSGSE